MTHCHVMITLPRADHSQFVHNLTLPCRAAGCSGNFSTEICTSYGRLFEDSQMPPGDGKTVQQRFSKRYVVDSVTGCWNWTAGKKQRGYGSIWIPEGQAGGKKGKCVQAHILSYVWKYGPVPKGLELDHTCRNRSCVNPDHLEAVTHKVNCLRGESPMAINARKTTCPKGHPYSGAYKRKKCINRYCLTCERARKRNRKQKRKVG